MQPEIWHVDDDEEMLRAMDMMLQMLSYKTRYFLHPRPASAALLQAKKLPDALLLDINMPEVSGLDMLEFVRRHNKLKNIPTVILSTEASDVTVDEALALGADAYVTKPVLIEELEAAIRQAIKNHE